MVVHLQSPSLHKANGRVDTTFWWGGLPATRQQRKYQLAEPPVPTQGHGLVGAQSGEPGCHCAATELASAKALQLQVS